MAAFIPFPEEVIILLRFEFLYLFLWVFLTITYITPTTVEEPYINQNMNQNMIKYEVSKKFIFFNIFFLHIPFITDSLTYYDFMQITEKIT